MNPPFLPVAHPPSGPFVIRLGRPLSIACGILLMSPTLHASHSYKISGTMATGGDVDYNGRIPISPDGSRVVYRADQVTDGVNEIFSVPTAGGTPIKLNGPLATNGDVKSYGYQISPDGSHVVYVADQVANNVNELFRVPIDGGTPVKLSGTLVEGGSVSTFRISPDGSHVVYVADQVTDNVQEIFSVPIGGGTAINLNGPLVAGGRVNPNFRISPDSSRVVYQADP
jgi:Tol biopolymer transport system component